MTTRYLEIGDDATLAARAAAIDTAYMQAMRARRNRTAGQPVDSVVDRDGYIVRVGDPITTGCANVITRVGTAGGLIVCGRIERRLHNLGLVDLSDAKLRSALRLVWRNELTSRGIPDDTGDPDDATLETMTLRTRT